ncbi:MAG TPA: endonuclease/exonuclease/phosphatase family protein [Flavisolibacter sp.]
MMKKSLLVICLVVSLAAGAQPLHVMTFNIRFDNAADSLDAWPYRKDKVASQVLFHNTHIVGVQEALHHQLTELLELLPSYRFTGVGRDDGKRAGEFSAILYDTARLRMLHTETSWLSETPSVPGSKSWDAAITRVVTWARFEDLESHRTLYVFNTHFDHIGRVARKQSAAMLLKMITDVAGTEPVIVTGDFNCFPGDEPIRVLTSGEGSLKDSRTITEQPHYGPEGTFNGFSGKELADQPIDYIFLKNGGRVTQHATLSQTWRGRFSSDHFPVYAVISY